MSLRPGPWTWILRDRRHSIEPKLIAADGEEILNFGTSEEYYPTQGTPPDEEHMRAIGAVPELLEVLTALLDRMPAIQDEDGRQLMLYADESPFDPALVERARTILAKATTQP